MRGRPQLTVREPLKGMKSVQCQCDIRESVVKFGESACVWSDRAPVCVNNSRLIDSSSSPVVNLSKQSFMANVDKNSVRSQHVSKVNDTFSPRVDEINDKSLRGAMASNIIEQVKSGNPDQAGVSNVGSHTLSCNNSSITAMPSPVSKRQEELMREEEPLGNFNSTIQEPSFVAQCQEKQSVIPLGTLHLVGENCQIQKNERGLEIGQLMSSSQRLNVDEISSRDSPGDDSLIPEVGRDSQLATCSAMQQKSNEVRCNLYGGSIWLMCYVNGVRNPLLVDTGSAVTIFNDNFGSSVSECHVRAAVANGEQMVIRGVAMMELRLASEVFRVEVFISPRVKDNVLGLDVMRKLRCSINLADMKLEFKGQALPLYTTPELTMIALVNGVMGTSIRTSELPEVIASQILRVSEEYQASAINLLQEYADVFRTEPLGSSRNFEHRLELLDPEPVKMMPRRVPQTQYAAMQEEIERMLRLGIIRKSVSPYASPVVLVRKKNGKIRFCVDYRRLNDKTVKDAFPLPNILDVLEALQGAKFFTTLDLQSGFWQIPMREKDISKTAFCVPHGHYEFLKMAFGMSNSTATFQRAMTELLKPLLNDGVVVFVDDIVIYSDSLPGLFYTMQRVFELLREDNLTLNPEKCELFRTEVTVLGHRVSAQGIQPLEDKVEAMETWPTPKNKKEMRSFLGLCNYYRQYVVDFAKVAAPLHKLTGKLARWEWSEREEEAFVNLKSAMQTTPVLMLYDPHKPVMVDCDSSNYALGGVLVQRDNDGNEKPVAFYSRCLSRTEAVYCVTRKELLAVLACLRHWRYYLLGRKVVVRTDHSSLVWLKSFKNPENQLARWLEELSQYDIELHHRPGNKSGNADALSRRPCHEKCTYCERREVREQEFNIRHISIQAEINWPIEQEKDPDLKRVIEWKNHDSKPEWEVVSGGSHTLKRLWKEFDVLVMQNGVLKRTFYKPVGEIFQTVVPAQCQRDVLKEMHEMGHFGNLRTQTSVSDRFYWATWRSDVRHHVNKCHICITRKGPHQRIKLPERKFLTTEAFERIAMDICGPFPETPRKNKYMLVITDYFSKWVEAIAIPNQEAITVVEALIRDVISKFGVPATIFSDQGAQFTSRVMHLLCDRLHIKKIRTSPYRPSSNGQCERNNRSLLDALSKIVECERDWDLVLPLTCMFYRASCHRATGVSPALLALGREIKLPVDLVYPTGYVEKISVPDYLEKLEQRLEVAAQFARKHLEMDWENRQRNTKFWRNYPPIDLTRRVYVFRPVVPKGKSFKMARNWWGPFEVVEMINTHLYRVNMGGRNGITVVHRAHLYQPHDVGEDDEERPPYRPRQRQA
jgi:transposase InsO family protein/predicted aspartyl protease